CFVFPDSISSKLKSFSYNLQLYLHTGQFVSSLPYTSVTGIIGEGVVLPCHVAAEHIPEMFSVQWIFNEQLEKITVSRYDGKSKKEIQDERYRGRTEFFHSEFRAGNMSLHLRNVKNSDKGSYTCVVSFDNQYHDVLIELEVAGQGGVPSIFLRSHVKQGISLTCHTEGWFPEPQVIWLDGRGQIRKELSTTKIMMMPAGLYSPSLLDSPNTSSFSILLPLRKDYICREKQCLFSYLFFSGDVPITIIIDPPVVLVGEQVTLHCWLADTIPSNMSVLWYKKEEGKNTTLCFSPSLGGVVEQCQNEEWCRTEGRWERRALLLIIRQVQVADEGAYVCAVKGDIGSQEAITHLDVTSKQGDFQESMCCYTCKSKGWYPKPEVLWTNYGGKIINVEAKTNVTWNEEDFFTVQSNITVPCDNVDVTCAVILPKAKKSRTGRSHFYTCTCIVEGLRLLHHC
uniref:Ig-like domain-containing protein n=1 Tax=Dromaius novaehollandiae TaxID=8790 RepID=A0A8C4KGW0_DRONO